MGFEMNELAPLVDRPVTAQMFRPSYVPSGMTIEPLNFPNLVTGFERNPQHAARVALYTRFTPSEWTNYCLNTFSEADTTKNFSERLRNDAVRIMRETDEKTQRGLVFLLVNH